MDFASLAASLEWFRSSLPETDWLWKAAAVQLILEAIFALVAIRIVCKAVVAKPRATLASLSLSWTLWLIVNLLFHRGRAWKELKCRCVTAADASMHFVLVAWEVSSKWMEMFWPFAKAIGGKAFEIWRALPPWQQVASVASLGVLYLVVRALRAATRVARSQSEKAKRSITSGASFVAAWTPILLGQTLFLVSLPFLWLATSWLPEDRMPFSMLCALRYLPMFLSLLALDARGIAHRPSSSTGKEASLKEAPGSAASSPSRSSIVRRSISGLRSSFSISSVLAGDRWLSFWACWPALTVLEASSSRIALVPGMPTWTEQQRALLIIIFWVWYCGRAGLWLYSIFSFILQCVAAGPWSKLMSSVLTTQGGLSIFGCARRLQETYDRIRQFRRWGIAFATLAGIGLLAMCWSCYQAFIIFTGVLKMGIWAASAGNTARALHQREENRYARLLTFWILTLAWDFLTTLTVIGAVAEFLTPAVFSLTLIAPCEVALSWGVRVVKERLGCRGAHEKAD